MHHIRKKEIFYSPYVLNHLNQKKKKKEKKKHEFELLVIQ